MCVESSELIVRGVGNTCDGETDMELSMPIALECTAVRMCLHLSPRTEEHFAAGGLVGGIINN